MSNAIQLTIGNENRYLTAKEYKDQRVVTFKDVDDLRQRPEGTAGRNFRENRNRFLLNIDFFELNQPDEIRRFGFQRPLGSLFSINNPKPQLPHPHL